MQPQVALERRALEMPSPRSQTGRNRQRDADRGAHKIVIGDRSKNRLFAPDRQQIEERAGNEQRNRRAGNKFR